MNFFQFACEITAPLPRVGRWQFFSGRSGLRLRE
jgi:hypothetical protein